MSSDYIFVYGTLRREVGHPAAAVLAESAEYICHATLTAELYEVNNYPGIVLSDDPRQRVKGEVYRVINAPRVHAELDAYEGCSPVPSHRDEYLKRVVPVLLSNGEVANAWVYLYQHSTENLQQIEGGDYVAFLAGE